MTDTYGHTLNSGEKYFWGSIYKRYDQGSQIKSSSSLTVEMYLLPQMRYLRHLLDLMTS